MNEMVDRLARALLTQLIADDGPGVMFSDDITSVTLDGLFDVAALARAALEAIREPTDDIVAMRPPFVSPKDARQWWTAMIDAMLTDAP
jgi:hypothetical protein